MPKNDNTTFFWDVAMPLLVSGEAEKGTMMGFPCLRINGAFFASVDKRNGDLVVKLPAQQVDQMIAEGSGQAFSPNGRRFKEWIAVTSRDADQWLQLIRQAKSFVESKN